jgi:ribosomal-protein-alanine N-acetyltransferase
MQQHHMDNATFIEGERIYLRSLLETDIDGPYLNWLNDKETCQGTSHHVVPYAKKNALDYIQETHRTDKKIVLAIILREKNLHIGNIALQQIHWIYRSAELAILLGNKEYWGQGYGLEASRLIVNHGFLALNLHRIMCATFENNIGMKKLALALGMQQEGVRRQAAYKDGKYLDIIEFGLLKNEFNSATKTFCKAIAETEWNP